MTSNMIAGVVSDRDILRVALKPRLELVLRELEGVALLQTLQVLLLLGAVHDSAAHRFFIDALAASLPQLRQLRLRLFLLGRDSGKANHHGLTLLQTV